MSAVTVRLDDDTANALDRLAESLDRSPDDVAAQAIREYVALQAWQRAEIEAGLAQADAGDFASDADVTRVTAKFSSPDSELQAWNQSFQVESVRPKNNRM